MKIIDTLNTFTMTYLDPVGIWISLLLAIPVIWTWIILLGEKRQKKKIWKEARKTTGNLPAVLIIDMLPDKDISSNIRQYLNTEKSFKKLPEERIISLCWDKSLVPEDMPEFATKLRKKIGEIYQTGADRIHLFFAGPAVAATVIGSELSNNIPTTLYQFDVTKGSYINFGPLKLVI